MVPSGWSVQRMRSVVTVHREAVNTKQLHVLGEVALYSLPAFDNGAIPQIVDGCEIKSSKVEVPRDCVLLSKLNPRIPRIWRVRHDGSLPAFCSTEFWPLRAAPSAELDHDFLSWYLRSSHFLDDPRIAPASSTNSHQRIDRTAFEQFELRLPPPPVQRKIAEILNGVDEAIQATRAVIEQTRTVKQVLLQTLLTQETGNTRLKRTEIGEIPEDWEVVSLGDVLRQIVPGRSPSASSDPAGLSNTGVLKVSAVGFGEFYPHENKALPENHLVEDRFRVRAGDLLITRANTKELVGASCIVPAGEYNLMLCDKTLRLELMSERIVPEYACTVILSTRVRRFLQTNASGTSGSMKNISQDLIRSLCLPLPPLNVQKHIVKAASVIADQVRHAANHLASLSSVRQGLMRDLLTGRTRTRP